MLIVPPQARPWRVKLPSLHDTHIVPRLTFRSLFVQLSLYLSTAPNEKTLFVRPPLCYHSSTGFVVPTVALVHIINRSTGVPKPYRSLTVVAQDSKRAASGVWVLSLQSRCAALR